MQLGWDRNADFEPPKGKDIAEQDLTASSSPQKVNSKDLGMRLFQHRNKIRQAEGRLVFLARI